MILTQMNIREGYWLSEKEGNTAITKKWKQFHNKKALLRTKETKMSHDNEKRAL